MSCATRATTLAKWCHLHMQWLLDEVCNTIRVSSRSSPQTNDEQRVPSYESLDLQANVLSLYQEKLHLEMWEENVSYVRQMQDFAAGIWACCRIPCSKAQAHSMTNHHHAISTNWLVRVSFLMFLEMSEPPVHLYWLANKLQIFFSISWKIKTHNIASFFPPMFTPTH